MPQTKIQDHFSPSPRRQGDTSSTPTTTLRSGKVDPKERQGKRYRDRDDSCESEGSEGLGRITMSQVGRSRPKRIKYKDQDVEEIDENEEGEIIGKEGEKNNGKEGKTNIGREGEENDEEGEKEGEGEEEIVRSGRIRWRGGDRLKSKSKSKSPKKGKSKSPEKRRGKEKGKDMVNVDSINDEEEGISKRTARRGGKRSGRAEEQDDEEDDENGGGGGGVGVDHGDEQVTLLAPPTTRQAGKSSSPFNVDLHHGTSKSSQPQTRSRRAATNTKAPAASAAKQTRSTRSQVQAAQRILRARPPSHSSTPAPGPSNRTSISTTKRKPAPTPLDLTLGSKRTRVPVVEVPTLTPAQRSAYTLHTSSSQPTISAPPIITPAEVEPQGEDEATMDEAGRSDSFLDELLEVDVDDDDVPLVLRKSSSQAVPAKIDQGKEQERGESESDSDILASQPLVLQPPKKTSDGKRQQTTSPARVAPPSKAQKSAKQKLATAIPSPSPSASDSSEFDIRKAVLENKGKQRVTNADKTSSRSSQPTHTHQHKHKSKSERPDTHPKSALKDKPNKPKKTTTHDSDDARQAETDSEDGIADLAYDEPDRFKATSRLRAKKETPFQRNLRKMRAARQGVTISDTESESSITSDSAASSGSEDFIVEDGGTVQAGLMPHQFSINASQTPEFKFKVVFHYLVLLVIKGPGILPLTGEAAEYFSPMVQDLRRRMEGYKSSRVRSQIWRSDFVRALETFPTYKGQFLDFAEAGCDACHMSGRRSTWKVFLEGDPYDRETHEPIDSDSESESDKGKSGKSQKNGAKGRSRDSSSDASEEEKLPAEFKMGRMCKRRSECYHEMTHWEDELYYRVRGYYRDLLRGLYKTVPEDSEESSSEDDSEEDADEAKERKERRSARRLQTKARVERLRRKGLVKEYKDVGAVTEWMDRLGYQSKDFRWLEDVVTKSEMLEHDTEKDD
ncbi:hypothetical protein BCR39DRAFT_555354 [Naematelia encephala]|uniref:DUF4211 domain-containing protein n=1 Tax=Naematelia encephala TaxID=71784 RepID=A0A1Y2ADU1_9TREE|nr:hypothetical protein BCR39DRAFT_555354 [Naematelia encephala]